MIINYRVSRFFLEGNFLHRKNNSKYRDVACIKSVLEFGVLVFIEGEKPDKNPEKTRRRKDGNQHETQPIYNARSGNRTRAIAVEIECSSVLNL